MGADRACCGRACGDPCPHAVIQSPRGDRRDDRLATKGREENAEARAHRCLSRAAAGSRGGRRKKAAEKKEMTPQQQKMASLQQGSRRQEARGRRAQEVHVHLPVGRWRQEDDAAGEMTYCNKEAATRSSRATSARSSCRAAVRLMDVPRVVQGALRRPFSFGPCSDSAAVQQSSPSPIQQRMRIVLVTGLSGSGKSVAIGCSRCRLLLCRQLPPQFLLELCAYLADTDHRTWPSPSTPAARPRWGTSRA